VSIIKILRGLFAIAIIAVGSYWLFLSTLEWIEGGFQILTSSEKGKDAFTGVLFSIVIIACGVWEFNRLVEKYKK